MIDELSEAEANVLDMIAKSNEPWVRRSLANLVAGEPIVLNLEARGLIKPWATKAVAEKVMIYRTEKKAKRTKQVAVRWEPTREYRTTFVALTSLGQAIMSRDVFERGDGGHHYQGHRRRGRKGEWVLPDTPIKSSRSGTVAATCKDMLPDTPTPAPKSRRKGRRAG